ncbi:MAG: inositol monophosphatase family protein [Pseudomonadota bacterium]
MNTPIEQVSDLLREIAESTVLPKFLNLEQDEVEQKSPGEVVTAVDRRAEELLSPRLLSLVKGSRVVGEEATTNNPALLDKLDQGLIWLVDPIDGTSNYAAGDPRFAMMIALLRDGEAIASWILQPVPSRKWVAERGGGAWVDGQRVQIAKSGLAESRSAIVRSRFFPESFKQGLNEKDFQDLDLSQGAGCAGVDYPDLIAGLWRFILYWRTLPWDHVPGALLAIEAGAKAARLDGSDFNAHASQVGLLIAPDVELWAEARGRFPVV